MMPVSAIMPGVMPKAPPPLSPITIQPARADRVRIHRGAQVYAVPEHATDSELRGAWVRADAVPEGHIETFTKREAALLLPHLRARGSAGRPRSEAATPDGDLIDEAMRATGLTMSALGAQIGAATAQLSRARNDLGDPLPDRHRESLRALIEAPAKA